VVFGGLGILLGFVLQRFLREPQRGAAEADPTAAAPVAQSPAETIATILRTPSAVMLMATFVCSNFVAVVLLSWMPTFLHERFKMSLAMAGLSATIFAQLAGMAGAATGGWLADAAVRRTTRGRLIVQAVGVFAGAPFVLLCGLTQSVTWLMVALAGWGFFKGLYDANIFASPFDVIRPEARGTMAGLMNCVGWLGGGGSAPIIVGIIAQKTSLGFAIATTSIVYCIAGLLLVTCAIFFVDRDIKGAHHAR
jgi:sugar phosphate permease